MSFDRGSGPPVVVVPGLQGRWEWVRPALDDSRRRCRAISYSLCGDIGSGRHGGSASSGSTTTCVSSTRCSTAGVDAGRALRRFVRRMRRAPLRRASSRAGVGARSSRRRRRRGGSPIRSRRLARAAMVVGAGLRAHLPVAGVARGACGAAGVRNTPRLLVRQGFRCRRADDSVADGGRIRQAR